MSLWYRVSAVVAASAVLSACAPSDRSAPGSGDLDTEVALDLDSVRFGWADMSDSTRTLTAEERTFQGGVLSRVAAVAEGSDGLVYVLDRGFHKIAVFDESGGLVRIIVGGRGQGPGEFERPVDLSVAADGTIAVLDQANSRISLFNNEGMYLEAIDAAEHRPLSIVWSDSLLVVAWQYRNAGDPALLALTRTGTVVDSMFAVSEQSAGLSIYSEPGYLAPGPDGDVIFALPTVGQWIRGRDPATVVGQPLYPELAGVDFTVGDFPGRMVPAGVRGIGQTGDGSVALFHITATPPGTGPVETSTYLSTFSHDGRLQTTQPLPEDAFGRPFVVSRAGDAIYVGIDAPYPAVVRYRLPTRLAQPR